MLSAVCEIKIYTLSMKSDRLLRRENHFEPGGESTMRKKKKKTFSRISTRQKTKGRAENNAALMHRGRFQPIIRAFSSCCQVRSSVIHFKAATTSVQLQTRNLFPPHRLKPLFFIYLFFFSVSVTKIKPEDTGAISVTGALLARH